MNWEGERVGVGEVGGTDKRQTIRLVDEHARWPDACKEVQDLDCDSSAVRVQSDDESLRREDETGRGCCYNTASNCFGAGDEECVEPAGETG